MLSNPSLNLNRRILIWISLIISLTILISISPILTKSEYIPVDDFSQFWAAGRLNITGGNPYSPVEITDIIEGIGGRVTSEDVVSIMLNPPWTLSITMPFALLNYPISRLMWLLLSIALVLASVRFLWETYQGPDNDRIKALILIFLFSPTLAAIQKGQFTPIILFSMVLTIFNANNRNKLWLSGIILAFSTLKPQLIYLYLLVVVIWTYVTRRWQMLFFMIITIFILTLFPLIINHDLISQYILSMSEYPFSSWATPTIGSILRVIFGLDKFWLQFTPMLLTSVLFMFYWFKNKDTWSWIDQSPYVMALSILTTAYAWTYDAVLFVLPIIHASILIIRSGYAKFKIFSFASLFLISILNLLLHTRLDDFWFFWLFPALFLWYIIVRDYSKKLITQ